MIVTIVYSATQNNPETIECSAEFAVSLQLNESKVAILPIIDIIQAKINLQK